MWLVRYKEVAQCCEVLCQKGNHPLQRSKASGLRADSGDTVFIDHADVNIRSETYNVFIVVDSAATFVTAFAPK